METIHLNSMPGIGDDAPHFLAQTTQGPIYFADFPKGIVRLFMCYPLNVGGNMDETLEKTDLYLVMKSL